MYFSLVYISLSYVFYFPMYFIFLCILFSYIFCLFSAFSYTTFHLNLTYTDKSVDVSCWMSAEARFNGDETFLMKGWIWSLSYHSLPGWFVGMAYCAISICHILKIAQKQTVHVVRSAITPFTPQCPLNTPQYPSTPSLFTKGVMS